MSSRPISLALTPGLLQWLQQDPLWQQQPLVWRLAQQWRAFWAGVNARQSQALNPPSAALLQDPVFIVGPWRSGTTVMHELLTAATGCASPLTWQCMNAPAFNLSSRPPQGSQIPRPMDGLAIGANSPQEDEFAILALGLESAYRAFLMPHRIEQLQHTLDPTFWLSDSSWLATWQSFLRGVLRSSPGGQPLILKSPNHSFRLPALLQCFPHAKLIWMVREPVEVFHSNRKMWRAMFDTHGLTDTDAPALDRFLDLALQRSAEVLDWCVARLPAEQLAVCSHSALVQSPQDTVSELCTRLQLPRNPDVGALDHAVLQTRMGRIDRYSGGLPAMFQQGANRLRQAQQTALAALS